jgi:hypothetical protein
LHLLVTDMSMQQTQQREKEQDDRCVQQ